MYAGTMSSCLMRDHLYALRVQCRFALLLALVMHPITASACPLVLPPVRDLDLARFYADDAGSVVDPDLMEQHKTETATVREFLNRATKEADASYRETTPSLGTYRAQCSLDWLETWARGGALLGKMTSKQAEAERRWTLAGAALAYLKVKPHAKPEQRIAIEKWLLDLASKSLSGFDDPGVKRNNHWYWMGLGAGATALATGNEALWQQARGILKDATRDVAADGTLPKELSRKGRALHYHAFALMPLMTLAELARFKRDALSDEETNALQRLASLTLSGLSEPKTFDRLAGVAQDRPVNAGSGWLALYQAHHPGSFQDVGIETPSGHRWLGGNVLLLRRALATEPAAH